jgi:hypothetical protein
MVPTEVVLLLHVPPPEASPKEGVVPEQMEKVPEIAGGVELTVMVAVV